MTSPLSFLRSLKNNNLCSHCAKALSNGLARNKGLTSLEYAASHPFPCCQPPLTYQFDLCSVASNNITGDGAEKLAKVVLEHTVLTDFCGIPLVSLRQNTLTELDLSFKNVGVPEAIVLSSLLPSATALKTLKYASFHFCPFLKSVSTP